MAYAASLNGYVVGKAREQNMLTELYLFNGYYRFIQTIVSTTTVYKGLCKTDAERLVDNLTDNLSAYTRTFNPGTVTAYTLSIPQAVGTRRRGSCQKDGDSPFWTATVEESVLTVAEG